VTGAASSWWKKEDCHFGCPALSAAGARHRCGRQAGDVEEGRLPLWLPCPLGCWGPSPLPSSGRQRGRDGRGGRASFVTAALRVPFSFLRSFLSLPFPFLFFSSFLLPSFQAPRLQQEPGTGAYIKESKCLFLQPPVHRHKPQRFLLLHLLL
jgi:hypothetical protein